ncbi:pyridoxamine 5'-phosphate oxidase family protein [Trinickia fusca]|uniref:Pyridoxamine 5'-phosphate oxidase family protein n=1 Tax=Trinickia fusca TaxID=2419777 RepID=A0A494X5Q1_9BURK|nr:pyridoxamine 5'-phosphate oxidase family protein [Trinickia fusca]RKP46015.1 pyridoxamine 5'-phosphate oxidase family protein [Trinickia fusca]
MTYAIRSVAQLEEIYGKPSDRSLGKEIDFLNEDYQAFVKASPLVVLASVGAGGTDCSPRGDLAGFVEIIDERTVAIPDRPGNNRLDNLRNIVSDPRVSLLFLVPGVDETLRVNGRAEITVDPKLLAPFEMTGKLPRTVIVVRIDAVYFHCSKALVRSSLWDPAKHIERSSLPSPGAMLKRLVGNAFDAVTYDRELPERVNASLY